MADWAMVALTAVYVIATILICLFNYRSAKASKEQTEEMKRQYDAENRPYITTELIYEKKAFLGLRFTNHGKRIANHVQIALDPAFIDNMTEPNFKRILEKQNGRECIIGIGQHYDFFIGTRDIKNNPSTPLLSGSITYSDGNGTYDDTFAIDLTTYMQFLTITSYTEDFLKEIRLQTGSINKIQKCLEMPPSIDDKSNIEPTSVLDDMFPNT